MSEMDSSGINNSCSTFNDTCNGLQPTPLPFNTLLAIVLGAGGGGMFLFFVIYYILSCFCCWYIKKKRQRPSTPAFIYSPNDTDLLTNPNSLELDLATFNPGKIKKKTYTPAEITSLKRLTYIGAVEIERENLVLLEKVGKGVYGAVYRAEAWNITAMDTKSRLVTVKLISEDASEAERDMYQEELSLTASLNHPNVVGLIGVCTKTKPECLILDAGEYIDLLQHLRSMIATAPNPNVPTRRHPPPVGHSEKETQWFSNPLALVLEDELELLTCADQICLGMAFLSETQCLHKDLAARNCIISPDGIVKVANFGISHQLYPEAYCDIGHRTRQPLRWMAPETIKRGDYTKENDIWAFGVVLWELFTYGEFPYSDMTNQKVQYYVASPEGRLPHPEGCKDSIYELMMISWDSIPVSRFSFLDLHEKLFEIIIILEENKE